MTDREVFKKNLESLMKLTKVKQVDIARYAEVSQQTVSAWISGRGYPRADVMGKLCKFFGVKQSVLTEEHSDEKTDEEQLLRIFRSLSDRGRKLMLERADELRRLYPKGNKKYAETETET